MLSDVRKNKKEKNKRKNFYYLLYFFDCLLRISFSVTRWNIKKLIPVKKAHESRECRAEIFTREKEENLWILLSGRESVCGESKYLPSTTAQ